MPYSTGRGGEQMIAATRTPTAAGSVDGRVPASSTYDRVSDNGRVDCDPGREAEEDAFRIGSPCPSAIAEDQVQLNANDFPPTQAGGGKPMAANADATAAAPRAATFTSPPNQGTERRSPPRGAQEAPLEFGSLSMNSFPSHLSALGWAVFGWRPVDVVGQIHPRRPFAWRLKVADGDILAGGFAGSLSAASRAGRQAAHRFQAQAVLTIVRASWPSISDAEAERDKREKMLDAHLTYADFKSMTPEAQREHRRRQSGPSVRKPTPMPPRDEPRVAALRMMANHPQSNVHEAATARELLRRLGFSS